MRRFIAVKSLSNVSSIGIIEIDNDEEIIRGAISLGNKAKFFDADLHYDKR